MEMKRKCVQDSEENCTRSACGIAGIYRQKHRGEHRGKTNSPLRRARTLPVVTWALRVRLVNRVHILGSLSTQEEKRCSSYDAKLVSVCINCSYEMELI